MTKILIIEDDKIKIDKLYAYFSNYELVVKESFQGGLLELRTNWNSFKFLILDMTIPLWEKGRNDLGGNYEQFGGERILREMRRKKIYLPTILFSMFDVFPTSDGNLTFSEINADFKVQFSQFFIGSVFYTANSDNWKQDITSLIANIHESNNDSNS